MQRSQAPTLNFGGIVFGSTATLPFPVTNSGTGPLTLAPSLNNPSYTVSSTEPSGCMAGTAPGKTCTLEIEFAPDSPGLQDAILALESNGATNPTVSLQGGAVASAPILSLPSGAYAAAQTVSMYDQEPGAAIYYTTNGAAPTASSTRYAGPISVSSTERLNAVAVLDNAPSPIGSATYTILSAAPAGVLNFSGGFTGSKMQLNGAAELDGPRLRLTNGGENEKSSAFYATPLNIAAFTTDFTFLLSSPNADGFTFTIQNNAATTYGANGAGLGYAGINNSVAIKFDLHNDAGEGPDSTGLYTDGTAPTVPAIDLTSFGINLHSGDPMEVHMMYDGTTLTVTITDTLTFATSSHAYAIDIPTTVGGSTAYVGFTGSCGSETANQEILSWTYVAATPGSSLPSPVVPGAAPLPYYPTGFAAAGITKNGTATLSGTALQLTDFGTFEAGSAFFITPVNVQSFTTDFTFTQTGPLSGDGNVAADGFTLTIQNAGTNALGGSGDALGYAGIGKSVALKFDLHSTDNSCGFYCPEYPQSIGLYVDGASPTTSDIYYLQEGSELFNLLSRDTMHARVTYDGTNLTLTLMDTVSLLTYSHLFPIDIPSTVGGNTAYVGFTGATGLETATQQILTWTFTNP